MRELPAAKAQTARRRFCVLFAAVGAVSLITGCGSDATGTTTPSTRAVASRSPTSDPTTSPLSKAEYIKRGDEICSKGETKAEAEVQLNGAAYGIGTSKRGPTKSQKETLLSEFILPSIRHQASALGELAVPKGEEAEAEAIVSGIKSALAEVEEDPARGLKPPGPFAEVDRLAREFGFAICGHGNSTGG